MLTIVVAMLLILLMSAAIAVYVAFPHRGQDVPKAIWIGDVMHRAVDSLPKLDEEESLR